VAAKGERFVVRLDDRDARTPGGRSLALPTVALAEKLAAEWNAQGAKIVVAGMPATRLANTALDAVSGARRQIAVSVADFAAADVVCYLAPSPASLVARQEAAWTPLVDWARMSLGLTFIQTQGIIHREQPALTLEAVAALAAGLEDFDLAGVALAAQLFGSAVLALALKQGRLTGAQALAASRIDEVFQAEQWGEDAETASRAAELAREADMLDAWFAALGRA
jgi:chaperone required for assembly of F1-ATPase